MKNYEELTRLGRIRRYGWMAQVALVAFGLRDASLRFIRDTGNIIYRVDKAGLRTAVVDTSLYHPGRYALRLHQPDYQTDEAVRSELIWLNALRQDAGLPVAEPVPTIDGELSVEVAIPGIPKTRRCSLIRWMRGRKVMPEHVHPNQMRALGRLMAGLHLHALDWQPPPGFARPIYSWEGLYGDQSMTGIPSSVVWPLIPSEHLGLFESVTKQLHQVMAQMGNGPDAFGLIHADLSFGQNVLLLDGVARAFDFDDSAFGYWMFDLGVTLSGWLSDVYGHPEAKAYPAMRDALIEGYLEIRRLPDEQLAHLEWFMIAWHAFEIFWAAAMLQTYPDYREGSLRWIARAARDIQVCRVLMGQTT